MNNKKNKKIENKRDVQVEKVTQLLNTDSLVNLTKETPFSIIEKKFLYTAFQKQLVVISALAKEKREMSLFRRAAAFVPFGILLFFALPDELFISIITKEMPCRICVGVMLGGIAYSFLYLIGLAKIALYAIPIFVFSSIFSYNEDFFVFLVAHPARGRIFMCLGMGFTLAPMVYLTLYTVYRIQCFLTSAPVVSKFFGDPVVKELHDLLQGALDSVANAKGWELQNLVEEHLPEMRESLRHLKFNEIAVPQLAEFENKPKNIQRPETMSFPFYIGENDVGEGRYIDFNRSPGLLVVGKTGSGKTYFIEYCVCTLLDRGNCELYIIDKMDDLYGYGAHENVTHITEVERAREVIKDLEKEAYRRSRLLKTKRGVRKWSDWKGEDCPKHIFIIIDEYKRFSGDKEMNKALTFLAENGRKYGIHIIAGLQTPRVTSLPSDMKNNMCVVAFKAANIAHANVIGEPLSFYIREEEVGRAVFNEEFLQTPKNDNSRWWVEHAWDGVQEQDVSENVSKEKNLLKDNNTVPSKLSPCPPVHVDREVDSRYKNSDSELEKGCSRGQRGGQQVDRWTDFRKKYKLVPAKLGEENSSKILKKELDEYLIYSGLSEQQKKKFIKQRYREDGKRKWAYFVKQIPKTNPQKNEY